MQGYSATTMDRSSPPLNVADYAALANELLPAGPLDYFNGGAADENTLRENASAWARIKLQPRVCVDVSSLSSATTVLGQPLAAPIIVAPTALQRMAHEEGEAGMARAADAAGSLMVCSTLASTSLAEIAAAAPDGQRWLQLYLCRDRAVSYALLEQGISAGVTAAVVTVDAPYPGRRERDVRNNFVVPDDIDMPGVTAALGRSAGLSVEEFFSIVDPSLDWLALEEFISRSPVPVLIKGVQSPEDARLACDHGVAGVIVSNHGGRQLDNAVATADILAAVVDAVAGQVEVLVDGGIRRGSDICAALALGAQAVLVGRPALWGLTVGGSTGAEDVLKLLAAEFELAMALLGARVPAELTRAHIAPPRT